MDFVQSVFPFAATFWAGVAVGVVGYLKAWPKVVAKFAEVKADVKERL